MGIREVTAAKRFYTSSIADLNGSQHQENIIGFLLILFHQLEL
jgi:hypothetical protein